MATLKTRIAAVGVLLVVGAAFWYQLRRQDDASGPRTESPAAGTTGTPGWDPNAGAGSTAPEIPTKPLLEPSAAAPAVPEPLKIEGTEVGDGDRVPVGIPWLAGDAAGVTGNGSTGNGPTGEAPAGDAKTPTQFRYEIRDVQMSRDRDTGVLTWNQIEWHVLLQVREGDGSGAGRVRLTIEWFRLGTNGRGFPVDFDSRSPDPACTDDPILKRFLLPTMAYMNRPIEFSFDRDGNVVDLDGVDDWHERYVSEVQRIEKGAVGEIQDAPTRETELERWSEYLFPRLGGGEVTAGEPRPWTHTQHLADPWGIVWTGTVKPLRSDPEAVWVETQGAPSAERVSQRESPQGAEIYKMQAFLQGKGHVAQYRLGRRPGCVLEAHVDQMYGLATSRKSGGAPGEPAFYPTWFEIRRGVLVRQTSAK